MSLNKMSEAVPKIGDEERVLSHMRARFGSAPIIRIDRYLTAEAVPVIIFCRERF